MSGRSMLQLDAVAVNATIEELIANYASTAASAEDVNASFVLMSAYIVFIMQAGFAAFVAGSVRPKHVNNSMCAVALITCVSAIGFYCTGFGFGFGDGAKTDEEGNVTYSGNGFIGKEFFGLDKYPTSLQYNWMFQYAFAAVTCQIAMGALVERTKMIAVAIFTLFLSGWTYPVVVHWLWSSTGWSSTARSNGGLLFGSGMIDFAGSGCVHLVGGVAALAGSIMVGPRLGRFYPSTAGKLRRVETLYTPSDFSKAWFVTGILLLWFGWFGFNPGSALALTGKSTVIINTAVTTTLSAAAGGIAAQATKLVLRHFKNEDAHLETWDGVIIANGILAGLVGITSGCATTRPWCSIIVGLIAGVLYVGSSKFFPMVGVDDPMDVISTHTIPGIWGGIAPGLFAAKELVELAYGTKPGTEEPRDYGAFMGGNGNLLGAAIVTELAIIGWVMANMLACFGLLKVAGLLRVTEDEEASVRG